MNPEVDIYLKYVELVKAKRFLNEDCSSVLSDNIKLKIHDKLQEEISYAVHLLNNSEILEEYAND